MKSLLKFSNNKIKSSFKTSFVSKNGFATRSASETMKDSSKSDFNRQSFQDKREEKFQSVAEDWKSMGKGKETEMPSPTVEKRNETSSSHCPPSFTSPPSTKTSKSDHIMKDSSKDPNKVEQKLPGKQDTYATNKQETVQVKNEDYIGS